MKAIIDGKRYNTETATRVCDISPAGFYTNDFRWEDTDLYITPKGNWFIAGKGNAMSRWARSYGQNGHGPGSGIRAIDPATAREMLERHGDPEDIEEYFGASLEDA